MNKYLELIRLPNVITASADSWAGFFIILAVPGAAAAPAWGILPLIVLVSCVLYAAGVIFNDVIDFEHDKTHRPDRPLPSGRIPRSTAFTAGAILVVLAILLAIAGAGVCIVAVVGFILTIVQNDLPWHPGQGIREHYVAVGESYSKGFTVGFFLCFSLTVLAISAAALIDRRRRILNLASRGPEARPLHENR